MFAAVNYVTVCVGKQTACLPRCINESIALRDAVFQTSGWFLRLVILTAN